MVSCPEANTDGSILTGAAVGHANPGVTMKVYAHMIDGTSGMAADGIDDALG
jgi:hypothetical protein